MARAGAVRQFEREPFHPLGEAGPRPVSARRGDRRRNRRRKSRHRNGRRPAGAPNTSRVERGDYWRAESPRPTPTPQSSEVDEYGLRVADSLEAGLEVTPGYWEQSFFHPRNVVTPERLGVRPTLVVRTGRSGDACLMGAAPRMIEALLACERELGQRLRLCGENAASPPGLFLAGERQYIERMRDSAALAGRRIKSLEAARRKAREAISYARPELADEKGWRWPDYGDESGAEPGSAEAA